MSHYDTIVHFLLLLIKWGNRPGTLAVISMGYIFRIAVYSIDLANAAKNFTDLGIIVRFPGRCDQKLGFSDAVRQVEIHVRKWGQQSPENICGRSSADIRRLRRKDIY